MPSSSPLPRSSAENLAFTGDTGWTDQLHRLARDVDLFLAEATLADTDPGPHGHLSASDAARAAAAAGAHRLMLTHFTSTAPDWLHARRTDAEQIFAGPIHIAAPGRHLDTQF